MNMAKDEWRRWRRLLRLVLGREDLAPDEGVSMNGPQQHCDECRSPIVAVIAADTERREREANEALTRQCIRFHEADQPLSVARAKANMLRRTGDFR